MAPSTAHPYAEDLAPPLAPAAGACALLLTRDPALVEAVRQLAAATGSTLDVCAGRPSRESWVTSPAVLVGSDVAEELEGLLPRRAGVLLVGMQTGSVAAGGADERTYERALAVGAERVAMLPHSQEWVVQALADSVAAGERCGVVAVVGGCGGAGASVLAAAVSVMAARQDRRVLLADLDPLGGGADLLLGAEDVQGLRWPDLGRARGRVSGGMLREALPRVGDLSVLSWDRGEPAVMPAEASAAVAAGAVRGFELVVADLARAPDPAARAWLRLVDLALLVVPATVRALAAAGRAVATLDAAVPDIRLVVRGPVPAALPSELIADSLGLPLFAQLRPEPGLTALHERAEAPGQRSRSPLGRCAARVLDAVDRLGQAA
jgi:secretion/DNA translocation related CpaE-like protein